ncbi:MULTISPECIES: hypothetical protein [Providencia]|uniref:hypothetical protein n=1 Tax=Providencia TaxID=586 RepID=UPI0015EBD308|nr:MULTISPECIES: hypothetical protein [Providencia]MCD2529342.1 hypothetical protein [Providencia huaxiensis]QLR00908.1 hypothetical protein H0912_17730 [Providencia rettgeri]
MAFNYNDYSTEFSKKTRSEYDVLLNSNKRELIYYIHRLQSYRNWRAYISDLNYNDISNIKKQIENSINKFTYHDGDINKFIDRMLNNYHNHGIRESEFEWLKSDERACFLVLLTLLIKDTEFDDLLSIEKDNYLNLQSGSIYYSIIAWFDKFTEPRNQRSGRRENEGKLNKYHEKCMILENNLVSSWLLSMNDLGEINYCYNYLQRLGMNTLAVVMNSDRAEFIFRLGEKYNINRKAILIAFFDYLYLSPNTGVFAAENLKMKMASALSSWKNRKNKEGYVDVHFDIKKENIPKLDELKKRFNVMSKKDVVNALIEYMYDKKE